MNEPVRVHWSLRFAEDVILLCEESRAFGDGSGMDVARPCICRKLTEMKGQAMRDTDEPARRERLNLETGEEYGRIVGLGAPEKARSRRWVGWVPWLPALLFAIWFAHHIGYWRGSVARGEAQRAGGASEQPPAGPQEVP